MGKKAEIANVRPDGTITVNGRLTWGQRTREKIDAGLIVERFQRVALGIEEATMTELNAARMLLDRRLPVIKAIEVKDQGGQDAKTISNEQLFAVIEGQATRVDQK
jgi:hypothetical protein